MDWLTFIIRLVEALAWPAVATFAFWYGRHRIAGLFARLERFKGWGAEAEFGKQLDRVADKLPIAHVSDAVGASDSASAAVVAVSELPPPYIVVRAWDRLVGAIENLADRRKYPIPPKDPAGHIWALARLGGFPEQDLQAVRELHSLRNMAAHGEAHNLTLTDALRYRDLVDRLVRELEAASPRPD